MSGDGEAENTPESSRISTAAFCRTVSVLLCVLEAELARRTRSVIIHTNTGRYRLYWLIKAYTRPHYKTSRNSNLGLKIASGSVFSLPSSSRPLTNTTAFRAAEGDIRLCMDKQGSLSGFPIRKQFVSNESGATLDLV